MSYNIHITRADFYFKDNNPITLKEIESMLETLPQGFSINRSGTVTATTPQGEKISVDVGPYLMYENKADINSRVYIYFNKNNGPWFSVTKEKYMLPIIELAEIIHAKVQGDEGEIYTKESILHS